MKRIYSIFLAILFAVSFVLQAGNVDIARADETKQSDEESSITDESSQPDEESSKSDEVDQTGEEASDADESNPSDEESSGADETDQTGGESSETEESTEPEEEIPELIIGQPFDVEIYMGRYAKFTVEAIEGCTYQWQYSTNGGESWKISKLVSAKTATLSHKAIMDYNGRMFRCVVTDAEGRQQISKPVTLIVDDYLMIQTQPQDVLVKSGCKFTMKISCKGVGLSYKWQYSSNGGESWVDSASSSAGNAKFVSVAKDSYYGRLYRCLVSSEKGEQLISEPAALLVAGAKVDCKASVKEDGILVKWSAKKCAKYAVLRRIEGETAYEEIAFTEDFSYFDQTAATGNCYEYFIYRTDAEETSYASYVTKSGTKVTYLENGMVRALKGRMEGVEVFWDEIPGAVNYCVLRKIGEDGSWAKKGYTSETSFLDTTAKSGRHYYYKVRPAEEDESKYLAQAGNALDIDYVVSLEYKAYVAEKSVYLHTSPTFDSPYAVAVYMEELYVKNIEKKSSTGLWLRVVYEKTGEEYFIWEKFGENHLTDTYQECAYTSENPMVQKVLDSAVAWLSENTAYKRGDSSGEADAEGVYHFDCSGFVRYILRNVMKDYVPTYQIYPKVSEMCKVETIYNSGYPGEFSVKDIPLDQIKAGDILFFDLAGEAEIDSDAENELNHVAIYLGNGDFIHCTHYSWGGSGVYRMPLTGEYLAGLKLARRFIPSEIIPADNTLYIASGLAYVRSGMGKEYIVRDKLANNTPVKLVFSGNTGWNYIEYGDHKFGYIHKSNLKEKID